MGLLIIGPLAANYKRLGLGLIEIRQAYQTADQVLRTAPGNPVIVALSIDGALLTITLRQSPNDLAELRLLTDAIQKTLGLQVELAAETCRSKNAIAERAVLNFMRSVVLGRG